MLKIWCHKATRGATRGLTRLTAGPSRPKNRYTGDPYELKPLNLALFGTPSDVFDQPWAAKGVAEAPRGRSTIAGLYPPKVAGVTLRVPDPMKYRYWARAKL